MIRSLFVLFVILGGFSAVALLSARPDEPPASPASLTARDVGTALAAGAKRIGRAGMSAAAPDAISSADQDTTRTEAKSGRATEAPSESDPEAADAAERPRRARPAEPTETRVASAQTGRSADRSSDAAETSDLEPARSLPRATKSRTRLAASAAADFGAGGAAVPEAAAEQTVATQDVEARAEFGSGLVVRTEPGLEKSVALAIDDPEAAGAERVAAWNEASASDPQRSADLIRRMLAVYRGRGGGR